MRPFASGTGRPELICARRPARTAQLSLAQNRRALDTDDDVELPIVAVSGLLSKFASKHANQRMSMRECDALNSAFSAVGVGHLASALKAVSDQAA